MRPTTLSTTQPPEAPKLCTDCDEPLEAFYVKAPALSYNGYLITEHSKTARVDGREVELSYAVLKKNGARLLSFDKVHSALGNDTRFGLFPFLGGRSRQLVVEQLSNRWWQYWVVSLSPQPRMLYESSRYPVSYELGVIDFDGDGVNELIQTLTTFYFFDRLCGACSPRIPIIFKYDAKTQTYLPASHRFPDGLLDCLEQSIQTVEEKNRSIDFATFQDTGEYLGDVLVVFVSYIYAGKQRAAWDFFDTHYRLNDK